MKNALILGFSFLILIGFGINESHSGGVAGRESREFKKTVESGYTRYSVSNSSGCTTAIKIGDSSRQLDIWHGEGCRTDIGNSVEVATSNFNDIVDTFDLLKQIKKSKLLIVSIGAHDAYEPLMLYINDFRDWPDNYIEHFKAKAPSDDKAFELYREYLRRTILESGLYTPVFNVLKTWGCEARLSANLFDPLFFDKHKVTGKDLIEWGVFASGEALKNLFPSAKGGLEFEMQCSQN